MKTILSIDPGIKNFSYCLLTIDQDYNYTILNWDIINLVHDETENICNGTRKNGNKCTSKSSFKNDSEFFCKTHKPIKCKKCKKPNCKKIPIHQLKVKLYQQLETNPKYKDFSECDYVLIELQPVFLGPKMKSLDNAIYDYFLLKSILNDKETIIKHLSASSKLKVIEGFDFSTKSYKKNKVESIKYTQKLVRNTPWQEHFNNFPKQDDLSDSFLQALYFINILNVGK